MHEPVKVDIAHVVKNNIYLYGIRGEGKSATHRAEALMRQKRFDAGLIHTHTFALEDLPTAIVLRQEPHRQCHQGGGEGAGRRAALTADIVLPAPASADVSIWGGRPLAPSLYVEFIRTRAGAG